MPGDRDGRRDWKTKGGKGEKLSPNCGQTRKAFQSGGIDSFGRKKGFEGKEDSKLS